MNKHIETYLDQYLNIEKPDYAVLIKGEWGCGKTYFIKNFIEKQKKKYFFKKSKKIRYISLNGISSTSAIISSILFNTHQVFPWLETIWSLLKCISFVGKNINFSPQDIYITELFGKIVKNNVLFLDDLERCKIEPIELLGFINDLVESRHLHVVIIGDETHISNEIKDLYSVRKEKIIGKTLNIQSKDAEVLPELIKEFADTGLVDLFHENLEILLGELKIVSTFCHRKQVNYRIVKAAIREFYFTFKNIFIQEDIKSHKNKIFQELFFRFLVMFYCLQTNILTIEDIKHCMLLNYTGEEYTEKIKNFKEEFANWGGDLFIPAEMWFRIFSHQEVDAEEMHKCILERLNPNIPSWQKLWHFKELEDAEIDQVYNEVLRNLENKQYLHIHEILHSFMTQVILAKKGFIDCSIGKVVSDAKKYMDSIEDDLQWNDVKGDIDFLWDGSGGYCYYEEKSKEFQEISQYLREKIKKRCKHNQQKVFADLLELIQQDEDAHFKISAEKYMSSDIFSANEPQLLWDTLINLPARRFGRTCYYFLEIIVPHHLLHHDEKRVLFWSKMLELANNFLREHEALKDNKAKCDYLKNEFVPQLQKMVNRDETF